MHLPYLSCPATIEEYICQMRDHRIPNFRAHALRERCCVCVVIRLLDGGLEEGERGARECVVYFSLEAYTTHAGR